jgi:hypothetical protein
VVYRCHSISSVGNLEYGGCESFDSILFALRTKYCAQDEMGVGS